jgi:8-oxo-dGTP pyrophosphatase MutT (NUDIX family)
MQCLGALCASSYERSWPGSACAVWYGYPAPRPDFLCTPASQQSAKRELAEELGMTAQKWTHINSFGPSSNGFMEDTQEVFVAQGLQQGKSRPEDFEAIRSIKAVSFLDIQQMIRDHTLVDGQTLAALMQYMAWRQA